MTDEKKEYFEYLDYLRDGGFINMYESPVKIMEKFGLSMNEAIKVVREWMDTFDERHSKGETLK